MSDRDDGKASGFEQMLHKTEDAVGGMVGVIKARAAGGNSSSTFVKNATIGDMYEIAAAEIAIQRTQNPHIRLVAVKMLHDHTTSMHQLRSAMRMNETAGIDQPPLEMDSRRKGMIDHLKEAPDDAFDAMYLDQQVLAHKETLELLESYRDSGDNMQLRSVATGAIPMVARHLEHIRQLEKAS